MSIMLVVGPNWAEKLMAWCTLALAVGVLAAIGAAWLARRSVKEAVKSRHAQIALEMTQRWDSDICPIKRSVAKISQDELLKRVSEGEKNNTKDFYRLERFANYFEQLGTLHKLGVLELEWIDEMLGSAVVDYWNLWHPTVMKDRPRLPKLYENWELIAVKIQKRRVCG